MTDLKDKNRKPEKGFQVSKLHDTERGIAEIRDNIGRKYSEVRRQLWSN